MLTVRNLGGTRLVGARAVAVAVALFGFAVLFVARRAEAQSLPIPDSLRAAAEAAERAGNTREALRLYVLHQKLLQHAALGWRADSASSLPFSTDSAIYARIFQLASVLNPPPALPDSAMTYEVRAQIAFDSAKTNDDFIAAETQYAWTLYHAPWVSRFWWNTALIRERRGYVAGAVAMLKVYLASPQVEDRDAVRRKLIGLEYQLDRATAAQAAEVERVREAAETAGRSGGGSLTVGVLANGVLTAGDSTLTDDSYFDTWFFVVETGQRIRVRMTASSYEPFFRMYSPTPDRGVNALIYRRGAEVEVNIKSGGTFFVRATSNGSGARTGPYTIVVERLR